MHPKNSKAEFDRLLQLRNEYPDRSADIDAQIRETFSATPAILVLDMAGFSRLTLRYGIIHFLASLRRLCAIALPLITHHRGTLVKQEADNIFAVFSTVDHAVEAAIHILNSLAAVNTALPDSLDLHASIGIGYGETLMIEGQDMFGSEMNLASKLGEDLARPGEILLTESAYQQVQQPRDWEPLEFSVSGLTVPTYKVSMPVLFGR